MADSIYVTKEMYVPDAYVFLDAHPSYAVVIHKTASPGMPKAEDTAAYFQRGSDGREVSAHYVVGTDGTIIQCVREKDGAGANAALPVEPNRNPLFAQAINWNLRTISIEHVDESPNNTTPLTPQQQSASFHLVRDICTRHNIPVERVVQHHDLQPVSKPNCAGEYPMDGLRAFLGGSQPMCVELNKNGEVCDVVTVSQFLPSKTEFACGFFAAAEVLYAGAPNKGAAGSAEQVQSWALDQYQKEYGSNGANKTGGVSIDDMHRLLIAALPNSGNSHYWDLPVTASSGQSSDLAQIKGALGSGYAVVVTVTEASIHDKELNANPYFWGASGTHVVLITGVDSNGDFLVHDPANVVGALQGANSARPQPRHYDHTTIDCSWASMVRFSWLQPFPVGWNAATSAPINQKQAPVSVPSKPPVDYKDAFIIALWSRGIQPPPVRDTAIFNAWKTRLFSGSTIGTVRSAEFNMVDDNGDDCVGQSFDGGICVYRKKDGNIRWF